MGARQVDASRELDVVRVEVEELRASRRRLALASIAERRNVERILHTSVQQALAGLAANLDLVAGSVNADPDAAKRLLGEMAREVRRALEETRTLAERIYPPLLEAGGLGAALRAAAVSADVPIRIDVGGDAVCPEEIAGAVYFCCLDVLGRVPARTPVAVTVRNDGHELVFVVVADREFEVDGPSTRDLVEALGGRLIASSESGGTRLDGSFPLSG